MRCGRALTARYLGSKELAAQLRAETDIWRVNIKKIGFPADT
ncbi:hypothetical protein [Variovorax sp. YR216]|nr:hypothetical protein [Variovorax sp. YR216]